MATTAPASAPGLTPPPLELPVIFAWQVNVGQALQDLARYQTRYEIWQVK